MADTDIYAQYEAFLRIDKYALDDALEEQPDLFNRVGKNLTLAISRRDAAKQELADIEAEVDADLRKDASNVGERITEKEIESLKVLDKEVRKAKKALSDLNLAVNKWASLKEAFSQRSYAIKELVALYVGGYFGDVVQEAAERSMRTQAADARAARMNKGNQR